MHAGWDQHRNLNSQLKIQCADTDAPSAALVKDLKQRGLLDDTLVIWGGEFGRTPFLQGDIKETAQWGRDHHPYAFTVWMTGGGPNVAGTGRRLAAMARHPARRRVARDGHHRAVWQRSP
jgi:hypothetical protein